MATDRRTPCLYYVCAGLCTKGRKADHAHYCQHCNKYKPRARVRYKNQKTRGIRMKRKLKFFTYGFYISMVVWACGLVVSIIVENVTMKILLILIPLAIYWFFIIGKSIIEEKIKKFSTQGGKRNLKCALYK